MTTTNGKPATIAVTFLHPRSSDGFPAEISAGTTGQQAIDGLIKSKFVEPISAGQAYALQHQRTGKSIPASASLIASGIEAGDAIAVVAANVSAGH